MVSKVLLKRLSYDLEGLPAVVTRKVLNVLKQEGLRALVAYDASDLEKEGSLRFILKAGGSPQRLLLRNACKGEWLTRKACEQDIEVRYIV